MDRAGGSEVNNAGCVLLSCSVPACWRCWCMWWWSRSLRREVQRRTSELHDASTARRCRRTCCRRSPTPSCRPTPTHASPAGTPARKASSAVPAARRRGPARRRADHQPDGRAPRTVTCTTRWRRARLAGRRRDRPAVGRHAVHRGDAARRHRREAASARARCMVAHDVDARRRTELEAGDPCAAAGGHRVARPARARRHRLPAADGSGDEHGGRARCRCRPRPPSS